MIYLKHVKKENVIDIMYTSKGLYMHAPTTVSTTNKFPTQQSDKPDRV